jgi:hypothetical protein
MTRFAALALVVLTAAPLPAQDNPFKPSRPGIRAATVDYELAGDMTGTARFAYDGDRMVRQSTSTMRIMGRTEEVSSWQLTTADSVWVADLRRKTGTVAPNLLSHMADAYDDLDGAGKRRFHRNMEDMAALLAQAFGLGNLTAGERTGRKTYAGQECEERILGGFTFCQMVRAPVVLHTSGNLLCMSFSETATSVRIGSPGREAFATPDGVSWSRDPHIQKPDSIARGFVLYLSSQELADSLAQARASLDSAQKAAAVEERPLTDEDREAMMAACEFLKSFDMGAVMASAANAVWQGMLASVKDAALDAARRGAVRGLGGIIRRRP